MATKALPTLERVRQLLDYDPETGIFRWKVGRGGVKAGTVAGCIIAGGYRTIRISKNILLAHRLAWLCTHGEWPADQIDHANANRDDNRISNLRSATGFQNAQNRPISRYNTSGHQGVTFDKGRGKWMAKIKKDNSTIHLGRFDDLEEAAAAYRDAKRKYHTFSPELRE